MLRRKENMMKLGMCWCRHLPNMLLCFLSFISFCTCASFPFPPVFLLFLFILSRTLTPFLISPPLFLMVPSFSHMFFIHVYISPECVCVLVFCIFSTFFPCFKSKSLGIVCVGVCVCVCVCFLFCHACSTHQVCLFESCISVFGRNVKH